MPQPPKKDESQDSFIKRCIPVVVNEGTAKDGKQGYAICLSMYRQHHTKSKGKWTVEQAMQKLLSDTLKDDGSSAELCPKHGSVLLNGKCPICEDELSKE